MVSKGVACLKGLILALRNLNGKTKIKKCGLTGVQGVNPSYVYMVPITTIDNLGSVRIPVIQLVPSLPMVLTTSKIKKFIYVS